MCRAKTEEDGNRRCKCDTSKARRLRRYNNAAKKEFSIQVIPPVAPKTTPVSSNEIPKTIENIQEIIQSSRKLRIMADVIKTNSKPAEHYDDNLKRIGSGIEYIAEHTYGAPTDKHVKEIWDRYDNEAMEYVKEAVSSGKNEDEAWEEIETILQPKATTELRILFEKRNESIRKTLADLGVEFANPDTLEFSPHSDQKACNSLKQAIGYFPQSWVDASNIHHITKIPFVVKNSDGRAHYASAAPHDKEFLVAELTVSKDNIIFVGEDDGMRVAMHEFSHRVEHTVAGITRIERFFLDRRAGLYPTDGSIAPEESTVIYKAENFFDEDEIGYKDNFPTHYMGKIYEDDAREILSMGMETLFSGHNGGFAGIMDTKADPEYKHFVLGILASTVASTTTKL